MRGPLCRLCRREGKKLFLKGEKCYTDKCTIEKKSSPPGQVKRALRRRESGYALHLREKQSAKRIYGCRERQFRKYFEIAAHKKGATGEILLQLLERRLDNVIYQLGFAPSRNTAKQLISHRHIFVNAIKVNIPSYLVKPGDKITISPKTKEIPVVKKSIEQDKDVPAWLSFDKETLTGSVNDLPKREDIKTDIKEELIIELYSK